MNLLVFLPYYLFWHYQLGLKETISNVFRLVGFLSSFFSLKILLSTLFSPWERMGESYKREFDPSAWFETFVLNTILRFVGFLIRAFTIIIGLVVLMMSLFLALISILAWLFMPILMLFILSVGLAKLFS